MALRNALLQSVWRILETPYQKKRVKQSIDHSSVVVLSGNRMEIGS